MPADVEPRHEQIVEQRVGESTALDRAVFCGRPRLGCVSDQRISAGRLTMANPGVTPALSAAVRARFIVFANGLSRQASSITTPSRFAPSTDCSSRSSVMASSSASRSLASVASTGIS